MAHDNPLGRRATYDIDGGDGADGCGQFYTEEECLFWEGGGPGGGPVGGPDCDGVDPVCALDDVAAMVQTGPQSMSVGCMCCFMTADPAAGEPFGLCMGPALPAQDFCGAVGATNNPDGAIYGCRHILLSYELCP